MIALLFAMLCFEDTNEIFYTLSPMEIQQIDELPEGERRYLLSRIRNKVIPTRRDWSSLNKGDMFFAPTGIKINQVVDESSFIGYCRCLRRSSGGASKAVPTMLICITNRRLKNPKDTVDTENDKLLTVGTL